MSSTPLVLSEDDALELFVSLLASARTQLDDPHHYGSMRLLTLAEQLRDAMLDQCSSELREMLEATVPQTQAAQVIVNKREPYTEALDEVNAFVAQHLVEREGLGND